MMRIELYMNAHEELIADYLEEHPNASEDEAYEATENDAWDQVINRAGRFRMAENEGRL